MTNRGHEYQYSSAGYTNPTVQKGLHPLLVHEVVSALKGVGRVCDLGCGNGTFDLAIALSVGQVVGVDRSTSGIDIAAKSAGARGNVTFIEASIDEELPARLLQEGAQFNAVVSMDVIEHLYQPSALIDVAWKILQPEGILIVCTPYHGYLKNLAISVVDGWDAHHGVAWDGGHIKFFSVKTLSAMVAARGFTDIRFRFFGRAPFLWKNMICLARKPRAED